MKDIKCAAVLGSGVMGSGIAALLANAGVDVLLLDIVPKDATDRNMLTKSAIDKQLKAKPASGFTHPKNAKRVTPGNLEDDLEKLRECDWVVEVVLERLDVKHDVYRKILPYLKPDAVLSTNTSTIPLAELEKGMPEELKHRFLLTHFFNPPRFLPLLEVTGGKDCDPAIVEGMKTFADVRLGKGVVMCKDTPGFLGNRIGVYWLMQGLLKAMELGISVEDADAVMGKPVGIPKTGVFGLFDLIGIDLMPHIAKSMLSTLPEGDRFTTVYREPELLTKMIADGYTGRKGKGGFYRLNTEGGKKAKEVLNLATGEYHKEKKSELKSVEAAKGGLAALVSHPDIGGRYAKAVLVETLWYAAYLVPEISDDILNIDEAMKLGYNWKYGPFELIDRLGGADVLAAACVEAGLEIPEILHAASGKRFYKEEGSKRYYLSASSEYLPIDPPKGAWLLKDKTRGVKPITKNGSAALWDLGDGVLGFELTGKGNTFDLEVMALLRKSHDLVKQGFKGMVIGHDGENFSFGANLGFVMYLANLAAWQTISDVIKEGQQTFMGLKYAPFPVVGAPAGMAFGGGCEILLHCDAVQAHSETYAGLVEVGVGLIPGWGGCKEMLLRGFAAQESGIGNRESGKQENSQFPILNSQLPQGSMPVISKAFEQIAMAKVSGSAQEAQEMMILNTKSGITMNRRRVLADAKALCLKLAEGYAPPEPQTIRLPGATAKAALMMGIEQFREQGKATPHDAVIGEHLATVLSGGNTDITDELTEQDILNLEQEMFVDLIKNKATLARIEHMLETSKPLRN